MMPTAGAARGVAAGRFADAGRVFGLVRARAMARWYGMAGALGEPSRAAARWSRAVKSLHGGVTRRGATIATPAVVGRVGLGFAAAKVHAFLTEYLTTLSTPRPDP
jgi:hypothetical protein